MDLTLQLLEKNMKTNKPHMEKAFKKRYNRITTVDMLDNRVDMTSLNIKSPKGTDFNIIEYRKDGLTDYVTIKTKDKLHRYNTYIDAEIYIADAIGEEEE